MDKKVFLIPGAIVIAGLLIAGAVIFSNSGFSFRNSGTAVLGRDNQGAGSQAPVEVSGDDDSALGPENAKVTLIEFSDFQCPFCRSFWRDTLPQIKKEYIDTGKVKFVYRDFPLSFHEMAQKYAQGVECAEDQGKFWQLHDKIFQEQDKNGQGTISGVTVNDLKRWAVEVGLNASEFSQCLDSNKYKDEVQKDFADGSAAGVNGTPTIFVNGRAIVGAQPFSIFQAAIDAALAE